MLRSLHIENYALIENLDIQFESGFSVITGETGAGKSILLGALALLLGARADSSAIRQGAKRCVAEAVFESQGQELQDFFELNDLDWDQECILRRELTAAGKSRAFVNDTPVSLSVLKDLGALLVDVHSQHQNLLLQNEAFQLNVIDAVADKKELLAKYREQFSLFEKAQRELRALEQKVQGEQANIDYLQFQFDEISAAHLQEGEQQELEQEQKLLDNAEIIKQSVFEASNRVEKTVEHLRQAVNALEKVAEVYPLAVEYLERIETSRIEMDDVCSDLSYKLEAIDFDPARAAEVNQRLSTIYSLEKKYHKLSVEELLELQQQLETDLLQITGTDELLAQKRGLAQQHLSKAQTLAHELTQLRKKAASLIEKTMVSQLQPLGMEHIVFQVNLSKVEHLTSAGQDEIEFLFSSNKNAPLRPLHKIASGGEIARVMLSLKALLSTHRQLPTIIFDEIDTGVSGKISQRMAHLMQKMATDGHQVISITHQPQIAAQAQHHYRVYKQDSQEATSTHIQKLNPQQRIREIATMLSGEQLSEAAISNAKTLLKI